MYQFAANGSEISTRKKKTRCPVACVVMASGFARRFGENKLLKDYRGKSLIAHLLDTLPKEAFAQVVVVTRYPEITSLARERGAAAIYRPEETEDISGTIRVGIEALSSDISGCMFAVGDQPGLTENSILRLLEAFAKNPEQMIALSHDGRRGNPVIFPRSLFGELKSLPLGSSGVSVIKAHPEQLMLVEAGSPTELMDVDTVEDFLRLSGSQS